ncbi:hypothetical protein ACEPAI_1033 [Sanghuangporus weigelae]
MKFNSPLPQPLPKECIKAAKIFKSFVDRGNNGLDGVVPRQVLEHAKGFAIFTVAKAGFLFSARAGSGVVIARLEDGSWSAPSAIGSAGLGVGGQAGAEVTDFLVVLNSRSRSFMSAGSLTLGGNMSIAIGPLGRNGEALGSLNTSGKMAAMYSYSKTRGLFGGVSIEGSVIVERQDANSLAYRSDVTAKQLLSGSIDPPEWAQPLIKTLETCIGMPGGHKWVDDSMGSDGLARSVSRNSGYAFGEGVASPGSELPPSLRRKKGSFSSAFPPAHWGGRKSSGSYFHSNISEETDDIAGNFSQPKETGTQYRSNGSPGEKRIEDGSAAASFPTHFDSDYVPPSPATDTLSSPSGHRLSSSLRSQVHTPAFGSGSLFNDPVSLSSMDETAVEDSSTGHGTYFGSSSKYGLNSSQSQKLRTNPFVSRVTDPFAYDSVGDSIDDLLHDRPKSAAKPYLVPKASLQSPVAQFDGVGRAIALFDFNPLEPGDLGFRKGQVIIITKKSDKTDDWWTGKVDGKEGIFPANFVEVV